jgi:hypothetical protein
MTIGKKVSRIGGERVVEIDAEICKLAKNGRGKAESRSEEIVGALVRQDHSYGAWNFFVDLTEDQTDDFN